MFAGNMDLPASANCFVVESKLASETTTSSPETSQVGNMKNSPVHVYTANSADI